MFVSSKSLEKHRPEMDEVTVPLTDDYSSPVADPTSLNTEQISSDLIKSAITIKKEPLEVVIKQEEVDISEDEYEDPFEGINTEISFGPILLKQEMLTYYGDSHQQESIESEASASVGMVESTATSMEDSTLEERVKGIATEKETGARNSRFECHCCNKVLTTKVGLKAHLTAHGIGKFFKCDLCGKICASKSNLIRHSHIHTNERPYECKYCFTRFKHNNSLKYHIRTHTNTRPFKCVECDMTFRQSSHLKTHMRLHSDVRPYSCEVCRVSFRWKCILTDHLKSCSEKLPHKSIYQ